MTARRVILPAEASFEQMFAIASAEYAPGKYSAAIAASPHAGSLSREDVERAANRLRDADRNPHDMRSYADDARLCAEAWGLEIADHD